MKKIKVLFLGRFAPPMHGAAKMNQLYFDALKNDKNFDVEKIKLNKYDSLENIGTMDKAKIIGYLQTIWELFSNIRKFKPEIVYLEMAPKGIAFFKDSIFVLISKLFRKNTVIHFHAKGAKQTAKNRIAKLYYKFIFKNTKIILLSNILFDDVRDVAKREQIEIVPNGIPEEITDKEFKEAMITRKKNKKPSLLFLSNMIESKGPSDVLKICNELNKDGVDFKCNFVGKFQDKKFEETFTRQLEEFGLQNKCKYLGAKYGEDKKEIYKQSNFLIFPTQYPEETFGLVIIEAFMYGIPAYSYNNASIPEIISKDFLGHVSKMGDWMELKKVLKKDMKKKTEAKKIREYFKKHYDIVKPSQKIRSIFKKIKGKP